MQWQIIRAGDGQLTPIDISLTLETDEEVSDFMSRWALSVDDEDVCEAIVNANPFPNELPEPNDDDISGDFYIDLENIVLDVLEEQGV
jgi:hypothetical protein